MRKKTKPAKKLLGLFERKTRKSIVLSFMAFTLLASSVISTGIVAFLPQPTLAITAADCPAGEFVASSATNQGAAYCFGPQTCAAGGGTFANNACSTAVTTDWDGLPAKDITADPSWTLDDTIYSVLYARALLHCMNAALINAPTQGIGNSSSGPSPSSKYTMSLADAGNLSSQKWKDMLEDWAKGSLIDSADDGNLNCENENDWITDARTLWQINSNIELLCTLGWYRTTQTTTQTGNYGTSRVTDYKSNSTVGSYDDCVNGEGNVLTNSTTTGDRYSNTGIQQFIARLKYARGIDIDNSLTGALTYKLYLNTLEDEGAGCRATSEGRYDDANEDAKAGVGDDKKRVIVKIIEGEGKDAVIVDYIYAFGDDRDEDSTVHIGTYLDGRELYSNGSSTSPAADGKNSCAYIKNVINDLSSDWLGAVWDGLVTAADAVPQPPDALVTEAGTSCAIPDIGWIMCPIINFMAGANDTLYGVLQSLLVVDTKMIEADSSNAAYNAWQVARNLANVGFVIVFLIIIFSQISSIGISNYGVKKMLPRLVIAAILVNVSFLVCQIAVDVSNIVGGSVVSLLDNAAVFGETGNSSDSGTAVGIATGVLTGALVIGGTVAAGTALAGGVVAAAALLFPVLLAALLAIVVTVFILVTRKVVILLLVVLSPLAFLAMLLPNTEDLFKQWRKILVAMLLVYPMIGLLFGGSTLASKIILGSNPGFIEMIVGLIVLFVPLLLTPSLLQASLKAVPALGGFASKLASRANSNLGASANKRLKPLVDSAIANRAANRTWFGKERVARQFRGGAKLNKDGSVMKDENGNIVRRRFGGAKTETKLDEHGKLVTIAKNPKRQTLSAATSNASRRLEKNIETGKAETENNFEKRGFNSTSKMDRSTGVILDRAQTAGLEKKAIGEIYTGRLKGRQLTNFKEGEITAQLEDAEKTVGVLDEKLKEGSSLRIEHGAENTVAEAIGVDGMETALNITHRDEETGEVTGTTVEQVGMTNLSDLSKVGFAAAEATKASELRIQKDNKASGVASGSVQEQKGAEAEIKVLDTEQESTFKSNQNTEEPLMKLAERQDAEDRAVATLDAEQKARLEGVAKEDEELEELEKRKQTAEQKVAELHAQEEADLAERKKFGGDLFDSAAAEAAAKATATAAGKRFDSSVKELATQDSEKRKLRDRLVGDRPDPDTLKSDGEKLYPGGASDPTYLKAVADYTEKEKQFAAAEEGGLRKTLQDASTEDYIANSRVQQAEMDKTLGIDAEMQKDPALVIEAAGVGTQDRVQASAARRLQEDRRSDVTAAEDLYQRNGLGRDENLLLQGIDINGDELFDETGKFDYHGEQDPEEVWKGYVEARKKIGKPLPDSVSKDLPIPKEHRMDDVQDEALVRRTIKEGDQRANERLPDRLAKKVQRAQKDFDDWKIANPGATDQQIAEAEAGLQTAKKLQVAAIEQYSSNSAGMSPFMSSGDRGALANGTLVRTGDEQIVNTFASEKVASPDFAAKWNIEHFKAARKVFKDLATPPSKLPDGEREAIEDQLAASGVTLAKTDPNYEKEFRKARVKMMIDSNLEKDGIKKDDDSYDTEYAKRKQSLADSIKGLDSVDDDPAYQAVDGRAHAEIKTIRDALHTLQSDGAIDPPSAKNGVDYKRVSYTTQPGVIEKTNVGGIVYLAEEEVEDPSDRTKKITIKRKYAVDINGAEHTVVSNEGGATIYQDAGSTDRYTLDAEGNRQPV